MRPAGTSPPAVMLCLALTLGACNDADPVAPAPPAPPDVSGLLAAAREANENSSLDAIPFALAAFRRRPDAASERELRAAVGLAGGWRLDEGHLGATSALAVAPVDTRFAIGGRDAIARTWDRNALAVTPVTTFRGHAARILDLALLPDGGLLTGSADGVALVHAPDGSIVTRLEGHDHPVVAVAGSRSGDHLLTVSLDGLARVWSRDGKLLRSTGSTGAPVSRAAFLPSGAAIVAASRVAGKLTVVRLFDTSTTTLEGLGESAERFSVAHDAEVVVVGSLEGSVHVWQPDMGFWQLGSLSAQILDTAVTPDGLVVAAASLGGVVHVRRLEGMARAVLPHPAPVHAVALARDGSRIATVAYDRKARLWSGDGRQLAEFGGDDGKLTAALASPDGTRFLLWGDRSGPARLVDQDGGLLALLDKTDRGLIDARFTADGSHLLVLTPDRTALVFPANSSTVVAMAEFLWPHDTVDVEGAAATPADGQLQPPAVESALPSPVDDYTDSVRCARCHRPEYERWIASSHAWTSALAGPRTLPEEVLAGETIEHAPGSTRFGSDEDGYWAETVGTGGFPERFRITHVSGHKRMRMFMTTLDDGRIQVLPGMTELPAGPWFDYTRLLFGKPGAGASPPPVVLPGEASFWTGVVRSWDHRCAVCHTSGRLARDPDERGNGPRSVWRSLGVDCETCHGPGRAHSDAWERGETGTELARLERFDRDASIAVCTQCHMEGDRVTPTYRLGEDLYEHLDPTLLLDPQRVDPYGRPLELIYDGLPFGTSHCAESGGLTCSKCHEPHGSAAVSQLREQPRAGSLCTDCHLDLVRDAAAHSHHESPGSGSSCIACHLPFLTIERGHGAVADHTIGVPVPGQPGDRVAVDACTWCHSGGRGAPAGAEPLSAEEIAKAYAAWWPEAKTPRPWMNALAAARTESPDGGPALVTVAEDEGNPRVVRASAARLLDRYAAAHADDLLRLSRDSDSLVRRSALVALGSVNSKAADERLLEALTDPSQAVRVSAARASLAGWWRVRRNEALLTAVIPVLEEDVASITDDYYRWFLLGSARGLTGDDAGALVAFERVLVLDPLSQAVRDHVAKLRKRLDGGD